MNKNDLVGVVADKAAVTKAQAGEAVDAVFDAITGALKGGDDVRMGWGQEDWAGHCCLPCLS